VREGSARRRGEGEEKVGKEKWKDVEVSD